VAIKALMEDPASRKEMGCRAKKLVDDNIGASARYAKLIAEESGKAK